MRIISKQKLREFWSKHPEAEGPLLTWHKMTRDALWECPNDVRETFRSADPVGGEGGKP